VSIYRPSARVRLTLRTEEFADTDALDARLPAPGGLGALSPGAAVKPPVDPRSSATNPQALLKENQDALLALFAEFDSLPPEEFDQQREQLTRERSDAQRAANDEAIGQLGEDQIEVTTGSAGTVTFTGGVLDEDQIEVTTGLGGTTVFRDGGQPPEAVSGTPPDDLTVIGDIEPISCSVERNGTASCDTCTLVLDAADAPFDPRILRAAHVVVTIGVVSPDDYQAGMERGERRDDGSLRSLVIGNPDGSIVGGARFVGYVDDISISYTDSGDTVTLECRDMSAVLRDTRCPEGLSIDMSLPLDEGVQQFITAASASAAGVRVRYVGDGAAPSPAGATQGPARGNQRRRGRRGARAQRGRRGGDQMSIWDHVTDVCRATGFIPLVDGFDIVITEARTLYSAQAARRMVYGRNLSELSFSRRLQGAKVPTIEVRGYDPAIGRTRWARWPTRAGERSSGVLGVDNPPEALRANEVPPSGSNPEESIRVMQVSGTSDPAILERVARNAFEQIGRQEIEGTFSTADAHSYDQPEELADLLSMNAGDPVELLVLSSVPPELADQGTNTTLAQLQAMTRNRRRDYLVARGWPERLASRFAALQEATEFQTVFRVQDVRLNWDRDSGLKLQAGFINYVVVREEPAAEPEPGVILIPGLEFE